MKPWSNLSRVVYARTYSRNDVKQEQYQDTVDRVLAGNFRLVADNKEHRKEKAELRQVMLDRKGGPAGRGYWYSGAPSHDSLGGVALNNCWFVTLDNWYNYVVAADLLMLGGGVGASVEYRYVNKLPNVKASVNIIHKATKDADFIVPDSREGWCELIRRCLEAFFVTGRSFTYSTVCIRPYGEPIKGFGGVASGPNPLVKMIDNICAILISRQGKHVRPVDAMDILCAIGEMVVAGNVRRSAIIIIGEPNDKDYLTSKRWDLGPIPNYRAFANLSVVCSDVEDLHPLFWKTYEQGEPFGIVNLKNIRKYGRMGELKKDTARGVNPCAEATLESYEPCNLQEIVLSNLEGPAEFFKIAKLLHRYGKRVTLEKYHHPEVQEVISRNRRVGTGITGCLESPLFTPEVLDQAYAAIQKENHDYSKQLDIPESIRTTVIKPSGTLSKMFDAICEGIHPAYSKYYIQRVRLAANDKLIPLLKAAGHYMEPVIRFDGTFDSNTMVVDFYCQTPEGVPTADTDCDTWKQLDAVLMAQKHWADQSVSVTVYYRREEVSKVKTWLADNLKSLKTISFLCHSDHGFKQAPKEAITKEQYEKGISTLRSLEMNDVGTGADLTDLECAGGVCPVK
jgi:ribonucleotide reductase alpha subunit